MPQFHGEHLPLGEQDAAHYLNVLLAQLGRYEWQFRNALALFDLCRKEVSDLSTKIDINNLPKFPIIEGSGHTLRAWEMMAARDGAMAIYHFGQALTAIARGLGRARRYALRWIIPPVGRRKKRSSIVSRVTTLSATLSVTRSISARPWQSERRIRSSRRGAGASVIRR